MVMPDATAVYNLRMDETLTAGERIKKYLDMNNLKSKEVLINIHEIVTLKYDNEMRDLDEEHVQNLLNRLNLAEKNEENSVKKIFEETIFMGYKKNETIRIFDGKHRLEAFRRFLNDKESQKEEIHLHFIIDGNIKLEQKLALVSMAGDKTRDYYKPLTKIEIMRNTQVLLKKCPEILGLPHLPENSRTSYKKAEECKSAVIAFFHVYQPSLVLWNIWKVGRISDDHSKEIFDLLKYLPSGFTVDDFDKLFNRYPLSPNGVLQLLRDQKDKPNKLEKFRKDLKRVPKEFIPLLNEYGAYIHHYGEKKSIEVIAGDTMEELQKNENVNGILMQYITEKLKNLKRYKTTQEKMEFFKKNFGSWFKEYMKKTTATTEVNAPKHRRSKRTKHVEIVDIDEPVAKRIKLIEFPEVEWFENFIKPQIKNGKEACAALCVYNEVEKRKMTEEELPECFKFYQDYIKEGIFDFQSLNPQNNSTILPQSNDDENADENPENGRENNLLHQNTQDSLSPSRSNNDLDAFMDEEDQEDPISPASEESRDTGDNPDSDDSY